jgi:hypothetical protein
MGYELFDSVRVVRNGEVETPVLVDTSLSEVFGLVVFLGVQGRMEQVCHQEPQLLLKSALHVSGGVIERLDRAIG